MTGAPISQEGRTMIKKYFAGDAIKAANFEC